MIKTFIEEGLLSAKQISGNLGVSYQTVRQWITTGYKNEIILHSVKIGGKRRISRDDLEEFLSSITTEGFSKNKPEGRSILQQKKGAEKAMDYLMAARPKAKN